MMYLQYCILSYVSYCCFLSDSICRLFQLYQLFDAGSQQNVRNRETCQSRLVSRRYIKGSAKMILQDTRKSISHRIHGTGIFTFIYHKDWPNVGIDVPVPWILWVYLCSVVFPPSNSHCRHQDFDIPDLNLDVPRETGKGDTPNTVLYVFVYYIYMYDCVCMYWNLRMYCVYVRHGRFCFVIWCSWWFMIYKILGFASL